MAVLDICGIQIKFPFSPYDCQVTYMKKVIECLQQEKNGVLESPTGTGKTLSLLCASLAWLENHKAERSSNQQTGQDLNNGNDCLSMISSKDDHLGSSSVRPTWCSSEFVPSKIIYASRTHSQLSQAVCELKRTEYNCIKSAIIGSREQLCVDEYVKGIQNKNSKVHLCKAKVSARKCHYYNTLDELKRKTDARNIAGNVMDIEDLVSLGTMNKICPYYLARNLTSDADIIFMPYNYLLDAKSRRAHGVELQGNIVIFDEAHNLEDICEDSASFDLSSVDLATAIEETIRLGVHLTDLVSRDAIISETDDSASVPEFTLEDVIQLKKALLELESLVDGEQLQGGGATKPGIFMFDLLAKVNITFGTKSSIIELMEKMISHLNADFSSSSFSSRGVGMSKLVDVLQIVFNSEPGDYTSVTQHCHDLSKHYKVHIQLKNNNQCRKRKTCDSWASIEGSEKAERVISYWCFSSGYSMQDLVNRGVKSIILTSGTLSPIDSFTSQMQIPFGVRLQNPHVIGQHQVWVGTLSKGPEGTVLDSSYHNRFTESYQCSLGNAIVNFARVVPDGLLVFFSSYHIMEKCIENWKVSCIWERIVMQKPVIVEPRGKDAFLEAINDFHEKINVNANGALFMAVCRGKVSEGLDFGDMTGRAVLITGLPFPPMKDPRVLLKMEYLNDLHSEKTGQFALTGQQWYGHQATRAVNQAIGRIIRHKDDFGAIILCDKRFCLTETINSLPLWVKPYVTKYDTFGRALKEMLTFFRVAQIKFPAPQMSAMKIRHSGMRGGLVSGAHFEPTMSRHTAQEEAGNIAHQLSTVETDNMARVSSLYHSTKGATGSSSDGGRCGLIQALQLSEKETSHDINTTIPQALELHRAIRLPCRTPRIKIKCTSLCVPSSYSSPSSCSQQNSLLEHCNGNDLHPSKVPRKLSSESQIHLNMAENYLSEVKRLLAKPDYRRFSAALVEYKNGKSTAQFQSLSSVLIDLFMADSERFHLFKKFSRFVKPQDKAEFEGMCVSYTGQVGDKSKRPAPGESSR